MSDPQYLAGFRAAREMAEAEARRYAGYYTPHSDGRNTFIMLADQIRAIPDPTPPAQGEHWCPQCDRGSEHMPSGQPAPAPAAAAVLERALEWATEFVANWPRYQGRYPEQTLEIARALIATQAERDAANTRLYVAATAEVPAIKILYDKERSRAEGAEQRVQQVEAALERIEQKSLHWQRTFANSPETAARWREIQLMTNAALEGRRTTGGEG